MNTARSIVTLALLAAFAGSTHAQAEKTRAQVKAEWAEAVRNGDVLAPGDSGLKLKELYPQRYSQAAQVASTTTRAQVKAELAEATRTGEILAAGDSGLKLNEMFPQRFPTPPRLAMGKSRADVKAELAAAIRNGEMLPAGDGALGSSEESISHRYARTRSRSRGAVAQAVPVETTAAIR